MNVTVRSMVLRYAFLSIGMLADRTGRISTGTVKFDCEDSPEIVGW